MSSSPAPQRPGQRWRCSPVSSKPPHRLGLPSGSIDDEDLQLALYCCYELHYRGFEGVDDHWEWEPSLLAFRGELECRFEAELLSSLGPPGEPPRPDELDVLLRELMLADDSPSVSTFLEREATAAQALEFMVHRSAYQLKEADPHSWALPRLWGRPKAAMVEIQADEYGAGRPEDIHAELFARSLEAVGLDSTYGAYLDQIPGVTLATVNLMSFFGLHRRLRGAIVGHLALFEMTSSVPNRRYGSGLAGSASARTRSSSSTSTSSPTRCTRASPRSISPVDSRSRTRGWAPTCCGAPTRCWPSTVAGPSI